MRLFEKEGIGRTAPGRRSQVTLGHACGSELLDRPLFEDSRECRILFWRGRLPAYFPAAEISMKCTCFPVLFSFYLTAVMFIPSLYESQTNHTSSLEIQI